jgi:hypothetical protein
MSAQQKRLVKKVPLLTETEGLAVLNQLEPVARALMSSLNDKRHLDYSASSSPREEGIISV